MGFQKHRAEGLEKPAARGARTGREDFDIIGKRHIRENERAILKENRTRIKRKFIQFDETRDEKVNQERTGDA